MKDASLVHVIHCFDELIHVALDPFLCHIMAAPAYELIDVHVHELEHQRKAPCWLVTANRKRPLCLQASAADVQ